MFGTGVVGTQVHTSNVSTFLRTDSLPPHLPCTSRSASTAVVLARDAREKVGHRHYSNLEQTRGPAKPNVHNARGHGEYRGLGSKCPAFSGERKSEGVWSHVELVWSLQTTALPGSTWWAMCSGLLGIST